jgi:GNAT superfamily N-acetyltransferase
MRRLASESLARGDAIGWFETLYREAAGDWSRISWADLVASVIAFDVSPTAIEACRTRFPRSKVEYATREELDAFVELLEAAASWLWSRGIEQWQPGSMRAQRPIFLRWARAEGLVVARCGAALVGGCFLVEEPNDAWAARPAPALYLRKLAVARSHAGRGVSGRLLAWCAEGTRARGFPQLRLDCWDGSAALHSFYRAAGFRELEAVPSHDYLVRLFERDTA